MAEKFVTIVERKNQFFVAMVEGNRYTLDPSPLRKKQWAIDDGKRIAEIESRKANAVLQAEHAKVLAKVKKGETVPEFEPIEIPFRSSVDLSSKVEAGLKSLRP